MILFLLLQSQLKYLGKVISCHGSPKNFMQVAQTEVARIFETMKAAEVDMFINADEVMIKFYL